MSPLTNLLYIPYSQLMSSLSNPKGSLDDYSPTVISSHISRSLTSLYCSHCSHSYHFRLGDNQDEKMEWFTGYHSLCKKPIK